MIARLYYAMSLSLWYTRYLWPIYQFKMSIAILTFKKLCCSQIRSHENGYTTYYLLRTNRLRTKKSNCSSQTLSKSHLVKYIHWYAIRILWMNHRCMPWKAVGGYHFAKINRIFNRTIMTVSLSKPNHHIVSIETEVIDAICKHNLFIMEQYVLEVCHKRRIGICAPFFCLQKLFSTPCDYFAKWLSKRPSVSIALLMTAFGGNHNHCVWV